MQSDLSMAEPPDGAFAELTPQASDALRQAAGGDAQRMRILTATAMFLAETEHAAEIGADIIRRAAALNAASAPAGRAPAHAFTLARAAAFFSGRPVRRTLSATACVALLLGVVVLLTNPHHHDPAVPHLVITSAANTPAPIASPRPLAPQSLPAATTPAPALTPAQAAVPAQPMPAIPVVQVRFYLASPGSPARARFVEQRLESAGVIVRTIPDLTPAPPRHPAAIYFHPRDAGAAYSVQRQSMLVNNYPILARRIRSRHAPPPGTIELLVP